MTIRSQVPTVRIVEVGPRDGLQTIKDLIPTETKLALIQRLEDSGLCSIELTSTVSPKAVPQLADCRDVLGSSHVQNLLADRRLCLPVLVPNIKGLGVAVQHGVREVAVFVSATEGFSRANINCTVDQGIERAREVIDLARKWNVEARGYVSCIFCDPYDGPTPPSNVLHCVKALLGAGCYEVSLGDTLGIGSPSNVRSLITYLTNNGIPADSLAGHFHDTYGQAVANVWEAYCCGVRVFDSSVGGLGGCPFAPGAKGNVASEDVVYMFHNAGIETGVDLPKLVDVGDWISRQVGKPNASRVGTALAIRNKHKSVSRTEDTLTKCTSLRWDPGFEVDGLLIRGCGVNTELILNRSKNGNVMKRVMNPNLTTVIENANISPLMSILAASSTFVGTGRAINKQISVAKGDEASRGSVERPITPAGTSDVSNNYVNMKKSDATSTFSRTIR